MSAGEARQRAAAPWRLRVSLAELRRLGLWVGFMAAYWLLDHLDARLATGPLEPTPWDLSGGLAFVALLIEGPWLAPVVALADFISGRTGGPRAPMGADVATALSLVLTYGLGAWALRRRGWTTIGRQTQLSAILLAAVLAAAVRAAIDMGVVAAANSVAVGSGQALASLSVAAFEERLSASLTGIFMVAPLILGLREAPPALERRELPEAAAQFAVLLSVCILVAPPMQADAFRYFYLLFLPQMWIALRGGVLRVALGNLVVQVGLIVFLLNRPEAAGLSFNYQIRLLALAVSSLYLAVAVAERRQAENSLRQRQDALARVSRLSLAGEMAASLAHELNQPLLAAITYARTAQKLAGAKAGDEAADPRLGEALEGAVRQSERAGAIVRNLRRFVGRPESSRTRIAVDDLIRDALDLVEPQRLRVGARLLKVVDRDLPEVLVNSIQIEQVLVNLVQNAMDSVAGASIGPPVVKLVARRTAEGVEIETRDSGLGVPVELAETLFDPLVSGKERGMGLGLAISRSLVEAHGGALRLAENHPGRCVLRFTLPAAPEMHG